MDEISVRHDTVVVRRSFGADAARVFRAWSDPAQLAQWHSPGDKSWSVRTLDHDFWVGGRRRMTFGPPGEVPYSEDCRYEDIIENRRICYAMTIARGDVRITTSMVTVEIRPKGSLCELVVTDQIAILDGGDTAKDRERGWGETLDKLPAALRAPDRAA